MTGRFTLALVAVIVLAVIVGIGAGKSQSPTAVAPAATPTPTALPTPAANQIAIVANPSTNPVALFQSPNGGSTFTGRVGQRITWVNTDTEAHTVAADNGAFSSSALDTNQRFSWTPKKPGRYAYGCYLHPDMRGLLIIKP